MNLTYQSEFLISLFEENNERNNIWNNQTQTIFKNFYDEIFEAEKYFNNAIRYTESSPFYKYKTFYIVNKESIPKPQNKAIFDYIPIKIKKHIEFNSHFYVYYSFSLFKRDINVYFVVEKIDNQSIYMYNDYVKRIYLWLLVLSKHSKYECTQHLEIFLYCTALCKQIPSNYNNNEVNINEVNREVIGEYNVNTAFTFSCRPKNEIIIFRKEEWFKVFIHESFHSFGLDFSDVHDNKHNNKILELFPVNSEVNLFEAYTEFWAEILNCVFSSYFILSKNKKTKNYSLFLKKCKYFIDTERNFGFFQLEKVLNYMGLDYKTLIDKKNKTNQYILRKLYKENSNILSYYVIRVILLNDYPMFIQWCKKHNLDLLQFKKTEENIDEFCKYIKKNYLKKDLIDNLEYNKNVLRYISANYGAYKTSPNKEEVSIDYILKNARMSIVEIA